MPSPGRFALLIWVALRLPLIGASIWSQRESLMAAIEGHLGLMWPTGVAIVFVSSLRERFAVFWVVSLILAVAVGILRRRLASPRAVSAAVGGLTLVGLLGFFRWVGGEIAILDMLVAGALAGILSLNAFPGDAESAGRTRSTRVFFAAVPGSGLLFPGAFLAWSTEFWAPRSSTSGRVRGVPGWLLSVAFVSGVAAAFGNTSSWTLSGPRSLPGLDGLRSALHADPSVEHFAGGDLNRIELGVDGHTLYVTGHGVRRLLAWDTRNLARPPRMAATRTDGPFGGAEDFAYDRQRNEIYVYQQHGKALLVLDGATLGLRRRFPLAGISPGDLTHIWNERDGQLFILSESNIETGTPFLAIDGQTGRVVRRLQISAGSGGLLDPHRPRLFLTFFRDRNEIVVYDTARRVIEASVPADPRIDGMAFDVASDQLLVGSPLNATVLRYDAETLERGSDLETTFGVRGLAVDPMRNLLLCSSLVTNRLDVIDLETGQSVAHYELGPWLRKIWLDVDAGTAYVSSRYGLYRVQYTDRLPRGGADPG